MIQLFHGQNFKARTVLQTYTAMLTDVTPIFKPGIFPAIRMRNCNRTVCDSWPDEASCGKQQNEQRTKAQGFGWPVEL
jgi:hypothetical protein